MKMGNIVPRAGIEPLSRAFWANVLPLHHVDFPDVTTIPTPTRLWLLASKVSADYYSSIPPENPGCSTLKFIPKLRVHCHNLHGKLPKALHTEALA